MADSTKLGRDEGKERGPLPGEGAVVHDGQTGNADFDGLPGDVLPPKKKIPDDQPAPPAQVAD